MDRIVHGVTKSRTRLSDFHFHFLLLSRVFIAFMSPCFSVFSFFCVVKIYKST